MWVGPLPVFGCSHNNNKKGQQQKIGNFFSTGMCSYKSSAAGCRNFPCNDKYAGRIDSVRMILDSLN